MLTWRLEPIKQQGTERRLEPGYSKVNRMLILQWRAVSD